MELFAAVIQGDNDGIAESAGITPGTVPHLVSARVTLSDLVRKTLEYAPDSALAKHVDEMLEKGHLYQMIGKWPSDAPEVAARIVIGTVPVKPPVPQPVSGGISSGDAWICKYCHMPNP